MKIIIVKYQIIYIYKLLQKYEKYFYKLEILNSIFLYKIVLLISY